jgi:ADP-ribosyl-[dinitrogen reductase] hydrolase
LNQTARYKGCLLGLAVGDALGTTLEFKSPGSFAPLTDMIGGGPFGLEAGQWTDDTSMALCLAESLITCEGFNPDDQMQRYVRWWQEGYMSVTGQCFDIGNTVREALASYQKTGDPFSGSQDPKTAGNGSIMRLAPVVLAYADQPEKAIILAGESSKTTHGTRETVDACRYLGALIFGAMEGREKSELLSPSFSPVSDMWTIEPLGGGILKVANGSFKEKDPPEIRGTGYVVDSLEAALWAFYKSSSFEEGALLAVNLGDDADTTGAVYGQFAGAYYGVEGIPDAWLGKLAWRSKIEEVAKYLYQIPDREVRVTFVDSHQIEQYDDLIEDFMRKIYEVEPGAYGLSDESQIWDLGECIDEVVKKVKTEYGLDIPADEDMLLVDLFERLKHHIEGG